MHKHRDPAISKFEKERDRLNEVLLRNAKIQMKRLLNLDSAVYREGALPEKVKELLGLVASTVLRCDDCILYHLLQCHEKGVSNDEFEEAMTIAWTIGGSITVPHLRRAFDAWEKLREES